jgi:putative MATE family efflux protein
LRPSAAQRVSDFLSQLKSKEKMEDFQKKSLFKLTYPLFLFSFMSIGVTYIDTMLLAGYSDKLAAAVSLANQILGVAYDMTGLLAVGALILMSQHLGRDEVDKAKNIARISTQASLLLGAVIALILVFGAGSFADWVNTPSELRSDVIAYVWIIAGAMLFNGVITSMASILKSFGHTVIILTLGVLANIVYIFLEYVLIYGNWGFPELGVYGAALSTLIVRLVSVLFLTVVLKKYVNVSWLKKPTDFWNYVKRITKISYPSVGQGMVYNLYQLGMLSLIAILGTGAVLTRSFTLTITSLISIIAIVISQGNEILVGYDKGANDLERAQWRAWRTAFITAGVTIFGSALVWFNGGMLVGLFTTDPEVVNGVKFLLLLNIILAPLSCINTILFDSLKVVGDVNRPVIANLSITFLLALPLGYLMVRHFELGVAGLWYAYVAEEGIKALIMLIFWTRKKWQKYSVIETTSDKATLAAELN